jgi:predicted secreted Zn-dependent protease
VKLRWRPLIALIAAASMLAACGSGGGFSGALDEGHTGIVISTVGPQTIGDAPLAASGPGIDEAPRSPTPRPGQPATPQASATRTSELGTPAKTTSTPSASPTLQASATPRPGTPSPGATTEPAASQLPSSTSCSVASPPSASKVDSKNLPGNSGTSLTQIIETKTYPVQGCNARDILTSLNGSTTASGDGRHEVGLTSSTTKYSFTYVSQPNSCKVQSAKIETQITVTLPELVNTAGVSADVLARWQTFLGALRTHEQGHVDIILKASTDMQSAFEGAGPSGTCQQLESTLKSYVQQQTDASNAANAAYDTQTNHGVNQGVAFP